MTTFLSLIGMLPRFLADAVRKTGCETIEDFAHYWTSEASLTADVSASGYEESEVACLLSVWRIARVAALESVDTAAGLLLAFRPQTTQPYLPAVAKRRRILKTSSAGACQDVEIRAADTKIKEDSKSEELIPSFVAFFIHAGEGGLHWLGDSSEEISLDSCTAFINVSLRHFTADALRAKLAFLQSFRLWLHEQGLPDELAWRPRLRPCVDFIVQRARRGPSVGNSVYQSFAWWRRYIGVAFPTDHVALSRFKGSAPDHNERQQEAISPLVFVALLNLLTLLDQGSVRTFTLLALAFLTSGARWKHAQLSRLTAVDGRFIRFFCIRGKRRVKGARPGFSWAIPRALIKHMDTFGELEALFDSLADESGARPTFLMPDFHTARGVGK